MVLHKPSGQYRADRRSKQHRNPHDSHNNANLAPGSKLIHVSHPNGKHTASPQSLQHTECDQPFRTARGGTEDGADGEYNNCGQKNSFGSEPVRQPAGQRNHGGLSQHISGHDPLQSI
ncbi:hypothetical protein D3C75_1079440 [compost metagenome]